jgi:hypothetical protein
MSKSNEIYTKPEIPKFKAIDTQQNTGFDSSILSKIDIESINKNNKSISKYHLILDFIYIKRRKYAMYNTEVKRKCIEMVRLNF